MYFPEIVVCQNDSVVLGAFGHQFAYLFGNNGRDAAERFVQQDIRGRTEKGGFDFQVTLFSG